MLKMVIYKIFLILEFYAYQPEIKIFFFHFELRSDLEPDYFLAELVLDRGKNLDPHP